MPLYETHKTKTALEFWNRSCHMRALPTLEERQFFYDLMIRKDIELTRDPVRRSIFSRMTPP